MFVIVVDFVWFNDIVEIIVGKVCEIYVEFVIEWFGVVVVRIWGKLGFEGGFEVCSGVVMLKWYFFVGCLSDI